MHFNLKTLSHSGQRTFTTWQHLGSIHHDPTDGLVPQSKPAFFECSAGHVTAQSSSIRLANHSGEPSAFFWHRQRVTGRRDQAVTDINKAERYGLTLSRTYWRCEDLCLNKLYQRGRKGDGTTVLSQPPKNTCLRRFACQQPMIVATTL